MTPEPPPEWIAEQSDRVLEDGLRRLLDAIRTDPTHDPGVVIHIRRSDI